MSLTRKIYCLLFCSEMFVVIHAQQPDGYLGCFKDDDGNSLNNSIRIYSNISNMGDLCKAGCREHNNKYAYAGTKERDCYCGSNIVGKRQRKETECNRNCPNRLSEKCGGYFSEDWRISLYDTWLTTIPVVNISGPVVSESTIKTTVNVTTSPNTQTTESSTQPIQTSVNLLAVYIAIPVIIVVLGVILFVIWRKKRNLKKDKPNATNQSSANTSRSLLAKDNNVCNDRDIIPLENSANVIHIGKRKANATNDCNTVPLGNSANVIHIGRRIENTTIDENDNNYNTIAQSRGLNMQTAVSVDANEYGHLNVRPTAFHDPTYSHTTGFQDSNDCTYSHMNQSAVKLSHVDHDTYSTCHMTGGTGKHMPAMKKEDVDDTYNTLSINGKPLTVPEKKQGIQGLNEPDYDHTDVNANTGT